MKKNVLALSIAAMLDGLAVARRALDPQKTVLRVTDAGVGHNLLVPYFNYRQGNMTVFHVSYTEPVRLNPVRVRFRSVSNSDDIIDFREFLKPGDIWATPAAELYEPSRNRRYQP